MKQLFTFICVLGLFYTTFAQQIPNLPIPLGAGNAEVWNGSIYHFGGSNNWSGSIVYPRIYKFDGNSWAYHDTIPDKNLWDVETTIVGNDVFLLGGWPSGPALNRKYNLVTGEWTYLSPSPNTSQTWGITAEEINGNIYLFNSTGAVFAYNIATDSWTTKTPNSVSGPWDLSSILFHGEIYILGWSNSEFYKYSPSTDQWSRLADSPYPVGACAFGIINDLIYAVGGNAGGSSTAAYKSIIVYDITSNTWQIDNLEISSKRHWMATAEYQGGLYVLGGINQFAQSVDTVEEIVPQGTAGIKELYTTLPGYKLEQNYPNPFFGSTSIFYSLPTSGFTTLKVFDAKGTEVATLVNEFTPAGNYEKVFHTEKLQPGLYSYRLQSGLFVQAKKLLITN